MADAKTSDLPKEGDSLLSPANNLKEVVRILTGITLSALPEEFEIPEEGKTWLYQEIANSNYLEEMALVVTHGPSHPDVKNVLSRLGGVINELCANPHYWTALKGVYPQVLGDIGPGGPSLAGSIASMNIQADEVAEEDQTVDCSGCPECEGKPKEVWWTTSEILAALELVAPGKAQLVISTLTAMDSQTHTEVPDA